MLLELHIADSDMSSGSIPVTWCLDKELLETVKGWKDPHIVIVTAPEDNQVSKRENRYVVRLKEMMTYVSFKYPGKNKIYAYLQKDDSLSIYEKIRGDYTTTIINQNDYAEFIRTGVPELDRWGQVIEHGKLTEPHFYATPIDVDVPSEFFAAEPAAWEKAWVLWLTKDKGIDQCAFRKRRILAYTPFLQPLLMMVKLLVVTLLTVLSFLLGMRGFTFKYLLHPLRYDFSNVTSNYAEDGLLQGGTIFIRPESKVENKTGLWYVVSKYWTLPLMPPILAILLAITLSGKWLFVLGTLAGISLVIFLIGFLASGAALALLKFLTDTLAQVGGENEMEDLICTGEPTRKPKKKSIRLRFLALKSQVCKPFTG